MRRIAVAESALPSFIKILKRDLELRGASVHRSIGTRATASLMSPTVVQVARTALAIVGASMMTTTAAFPWGGLPRGASLAVVHSTRIPIASAVPRRSGGMVQASAVCERGCDMTRHETVAETASTVLGAVLVAAVASNVAADAATSLEVPPVEEIPGELDGYLSVRQPGGALPGSAAAGAHVVDSLDLRDDLDRLYDFDPLSIFDPLGVRSVNQPTPAA